MWLDFVTYLHHHGHEQKLPWYRGKVHWCYYIYIYPLKIPDTCKGFILPRSNLRPVFRQEWSYLRGGLTTVDRDYGWINGIHHDIGTHVIHHLFPQIPHYHLVEAVLHLHCSKKYFSDCKLIKWRLVHYERILIAWFLPLQTRAAKPVLGKYYREPKKSGPFPLHLFSNLVRSIREDHYVSDTGDVVYYQTDPQLCTIKSNWYS